MERIIKFRAKSISNGEFAYGMPLPSKFGCGYMLNIDDAMDADFYHSRYTMPRCGSSIAINEDTIGQFTGLKDANGVEIYEGDIIASGKNNEIRHIVSYHDADAEYVAYYSKTDYCGIDQKWINDFSKVVIGNIYDNPGLVNK